jgi:transcriptional regulator of acetoin/glycerol metabolism
VQTPDLATPPRVAVDPDSITPATLRAALGAHHGNLAAAARALGLHRSQIYRLLERYAIERDA